MARARNIKPGFFTNDQLAEALPLARILFAGLWCFADREGRLYDRPKKIKAEILPYDDCNADELLESLAKLGFILRYEVSGIRYIQIVNFNKHQNPHVKEQASEIPSPDLHQTCTSQQQVNSDKSTEVAGLIPSSLNPHPDSIGEPPSLRDAPPQKKNCKSGGVLSLWLSDVKKSGERAVSDYQPLWGYVDTVGLDRDWIQIAWLEFVERYTHDEKAKRKRYSDWRRVFLRAIKENWFGLWFWSEADKAFRLSSKGVQADLSTREKAA